MASDPFIDRANTKGVNPLVYWLCRAVLQPFFHLWFRVQRIGREHIPESGGFIIAANHRSFIDPFVIGIMMRRPIYFVAKRELFERRFFGWLLNNLGAFPINRGAADEDAMATARMLLERGEGVLIFPEGTRVRPGPIGSARRGVGRLALETGVPVIPLSILGHREHPPRDLAAPAEGPRPRRPRRSPSRRSTRRARSSPRRSPSGSGRASRCSGSGSAGCRRCAVPSSSGPAPGAPAWPSGWPARASRSSSAAARVSRPPRCSPSARTPRYLPGDRLPREPRDLDVRSA